MTIVKWIPVDFSIDSGKNKIDPVVNILHFKPEPAYKYLLSIREHSGFLKCPALSDFLKNVFVIKCPYDITLEIDIDKGSIFIEGYDQEFFDNNMKLRPSPNGKDPAILHFLPKSIFVTDSKLPVTITLLPWFFKKNDISIVPGKFDITKWIRPTEGAFEIYQSGQYKFKRGEPLYCIKFETSDNKVAIERSVLTEEIVDAWQACANVKKKIPNLNLKTVYEMSEEYIKIMKKRIFRSLDK
jgi:hypothetical protein